MMVRAGSPRSSLSSSLVLPAVLTTDATANTTITRIHTEDASCAEPTHCVMSIGSLSPLKRVDELDEMVRGEDQRVSDVLTIEQQRPGKRRLEQVGGECVFAHLILAIRYSIGCGWV